MRPIRKGEDPGGLLRLWICRMFGPANALERLISKRGFTDDDVARALVLRNAPGLAEDDYDPEVARKAVSGRSRLMQSGLVKWSCRSRGEDLEMANDEVGGSLLSEAFSVETAIRTIAAPAPWPTLTFRDYPHLQETLGYLRRYLRGTS